VFIFNYQNTVWTAIFRMSTNFNIWCYVKHTWMCKICRPYMAMHKTTTIKINIIGDHKTVCNKLIKICSNNKQSSNTPVYIVHLSIPNNNLGQIDVRIRQVSYKNMEWKSKMIQNIWKIHAYTIILEYVHTNLSIKLKIKLGVNVLSCSLLKKNSRHRCMWFIMWLCYLIDYIFFLYQSCVYVMHNVKG
jgi:hypothetical protein